MLFLICRKENANERKESLLSICQVQLFLCKETIFPRNFQGFKEKILEKGEEKNRVGGKRSSFSPTFVFRPLTFVLQSHPWSNALYEVSVR